MAGVPRPLRVSLLLAAVAHGAALGALVIARPAPAGEAPAPIAEAPMDLLVFEISPSDAPRPQGEERRAEPPREGESAAASLSPRSLRTAAREPVAAASANVEAPASSAAAAPAVDGLLPDDRAQRGQRAIASILRAGGLSLPAPGSPPGPRAEASADRAAELLHESLDEADRQKGLGAGGPCATQAQAAMRMEGAPTTGVGTFEIVTDESGQVTGVILADSNAAGFQRVRDALLGLLRSQRLRVPPGARGMRILVRVEARVQTPSGLADGKHVEFSGLGGKFDLADIGAHAVRVVSARVVGEQRL